MNAVTSGRATPWSGSPARTACGLCTAAVLLNLALWHQALLSAAHGAAQTALMTLWLIMVWGVAPGALTHLVIGKSTRRGSWRAPFTATAVSLALAWGISALLHAFLTDPQFRVQAMNGPGHHHVLHPTDAGTIGLIPLLVPVTYAVVLTVILGLRPRPGVSAGARPASSAPAPEATS
ncbi:MULTISPECIES: hypothetical protein [unclassified Streptomyces]|uniref:hypothetical protein n=1 Tax=unclassified Streptomyces TaxID=2593676 RepID=UPI003450F5D0